MKKIIFFGLGVSAKPAIKFYLQQGYQVTISDDHPLSVQKLKEWVVTAIPDFASNLLACFALEEINWQGAECLVIAPSTHFKYHPHQIVQLARQNNCPVTCDVELLYRLNPEAFYIGITGTNGKSTTTALIGHIFKENKQVSAVGGNIGIACFDLPRLSENQYYILELSSYQLDLLDRACFWVTCLLNITPDHLEHHGTMEEYIAAKKRIFNNQQPGSTAIIGYDNSYCRQIYQELKNHSDFKGCLFPISTQEILPDGISVIEGVIYNNVNPSVPEQLTLGELEQLRGEHNAQNIAAAFGAALASGISAQGIIAAIKTFIGLKHRIQLVGKLGKMNFINDSKATNADSTSNALKIYDNIYWILGGRPKEGGISSLEPYFSKIKYAFLIGEASEEFAKVLENKVKYYKCGTLKEAFALAVSKAEEDSAIYAGKNILLSPACASFDQWQNFEERGDYFCQLVNQLKENYAK